jgi:selenocysteine lyase/cysteine desulfurase
MIENLKANKNIVLLGNFNKLKEGNTNVDRVPILSFLIKFKNTYLHYNFVSVLLNDLFGIQCRGGCMCAGPYGFE